MMHKFTLTVLLFLLLSLTAFAQVNSEFCGTTESYLEILEKHPEVKLQREASDKALLEIDKILFERNYKKGYPSNNEAANKIMEAQGVVYTIPVVFHILHQGGSENISEAQVKNCIEQLNKDFSATTPDTANTQTPFRGLEANVEIRFQLATIDPSNNCTNGIIRHFDTNTDWIKNTTPFDYTWNTSKYYNIYVVRSLQSSTQSNIAGYSSFPGSNSVASGEDVTVILHGYIGSIGTGTPLRSHTIAHETGHFLNLYHIWDCCTSVETVCGTDGVGDTPQTMGHNNICPSGVANQICMPGVDENPNNYMDYSYCYTMFTAGQATRMRNTVINNTGNVGRSNLVSNTNLINTGITSPQVCVPIADFNTTKTFICANNTVTFSDHSENAHPTSWTWDFPGGTPSTSIDSMPVISYLTPGVYPVSYTATTSAGGGTITKTNHINVGNSVASVQSSLIEGFESITIPNTDWVIDNTSAGVMWEQDNTVAASGTTCVKINNFINTSNAEEILYTPSYNINGINAASPGTTFTFKLAYQRKATDAAEKLQVYSSSNCGQTWSLRYSKTGSALATVTTTNTNAFIPTASQWRTETVSTSALLGQSNVWFKFVFTSDPAASMNNIYIDDINISNNGIGLNELFESGLAYNAFPNPTEGELTITFNLAEKRNVKLELVDVLGKIIDSTSSLGFPSGSHNIELAKNMKLSSGIYFTKLFIDGKIYSQKIIVE